MEEVDEHGMYTSPANDVFYNCKTASDIKTKLYPSPLVLIKYIFIPFCGFNECENDTFLRFGQTLQSINFGF